MKGDTAATLALLNDALEDEYAQYIEMATQAAIVSGEQALYVKAFFEQQAQGSLLHAEKLRERIFFLGGTPSTKVGGTKVYPTPVEALKAGVDEHQRLVDRYRKILVSIKRSDGDILYETIETILEGEQEDLESFRRLAGRITG